MFSCNLMGNLQSSEDAGHLFQQLEISLRYVALCTRADLKIAAQLRFEIILRTSTVYLRWNLPELGTLHLTLNKSWHYDRYTLTRSLLGA